MPGLIDRARRFLPRRDRAASDAPLLELRDRLRRLSAELDTLAAEPVSRFAAAHHAEAATRAFEATLAESCRALGIAPPMNDDRTARIVVMEAELVRAGWTW